MKVICDRGALLDSLQLVSGVVPSRTPKPVLTCLKLVADDQTLTISATDLEASIRVTTPRVQVQEAGEALIPADKLSQIVRESLDATLTVEVEAEMTQIRSQDSRFKVYGYPISDFPPIPEFSGDADFEIAADDLNKLINQTSFATAREISRYAFNGVLVERDGNKLTVVATDGRRLALAKGSCKAKKSDSHSAIVPTRALNLLQKLLTDPEQVVKVRIADQQIMFATESAVLTSNLVEGTFPPYKDVVPKDGDKKATLATDALASAVRRAALLTNEESKSVRFTFNKKGLTLKSQAPEMGEAEISLEVPKYEGEPVEIGFNPNFILDALRVIEDEQVTMELKAANRPGVIRTGPNYLYVVMPVNLQA